MTGAEVTAAASDMSVVSVVFLVMMGGCAFGMALGYPPHWMIAAAVLFLLASGYVGVAISIVAIAFTLRSYASSLLAWLENLDVGRTMSRNTGEQTRYRRSTGPHAGDKRARSSKAQKDARYNYDDMFGSRGSGAKVQSKPKRKGRTPEMVLGVRNGFTMKDLDTARRKLAKKFHPDLHRTASLKKQEHMAAKMRAVNDAYETLKPQAG